MYKYLYTANKQVFLVQYNNSPSDIHQEGLWKQIVVASWHWRLFWVYSKTTSPSNPSKTFNHGQYHSEICRVLSSQTTCWDIQETCLFFVCFFGSYLVVWICKRSHERDRYFGIPRLNPKPLGPKPFASFWIKGQNYLPHISVPNNSF